jgi:hypothetical protein
MPISSFILVLAILWVPIIAIYVTLFSMGPGLGKSEQTVPPAKSESKPELLEIRHAA